jgi:hypothetical protein
VGDGQEGEGLCRLDSSIHIFYYIVDYTRGQIMSEILECDRPY